MASPSDDSKPHYVKRYETYAYSPSHATFDEQLVRSNLLNEQLKKAGVKIDVMPHSKTWLGQPNDHQLVFSFHTQVEGWYLPKADGKPYDKKLHAFGVGDTGFNNQKEGEKNYDERRHNFHQTDNRVRYEKDAAGSYIPIYSKVAGAGAADAELNRKEALSEMQALPEGIRPRAEDIVVRVLEGSAIHYCAFSDDYLKRMEIWLKEEAKRAESERLAREEAAKLALERGVKAAKTEPSKAPPPRLKVNEVAPMPRLMEEGPSPELPPVLLPQQPQLQQPQLQQPQLQQQVPGGQPVLPQAQQHSQYAIPQQFMQQNAPQEVPVAFPGLQQQNDGINTAAAIALAMKNKDPKAAALALKAYNDSHSLPADAKQINELAIRHFNAMTESDAQIAANMMASGSVQSVTQAVNIAAAAQLYSEQRAGTRDAVAMNRIVPDFSFGPGAAPAPGAAGQQLNNALMSAANLSNVPLAQKTNASLPLKNAGRGDVNSL